MNITDITSNEDFALHLSGIISNEVQNLTGQPITESEDAYLAVCIMEWLAQTKVSHKDINLTTLDL